ncbi:uncharacterized protein EV422DRAFT_527053 [Fimicolochytrium jonesii]|uniref:uncharacterized protein n=1 Tax=Fimicolochytrium jonesii TaxID=1396493 RepID=UPI0022FEC5BF|nr:uncharacterized protein EV422DRAFT_527053 [Fimicolochytrium jonesii]KAI8821802.1 hypothetical protein EV422DRAFT_527053 [Fimicolochytrium jonesii]
MADRKLPSAPPSYKAATGRPPTPPEKQRDYLIEPSAPPLPNRPGPPLPSPPLPSRPYGSSSTFTHLELSTPDTAEGSSDDKKLPADVEFRSDGRFTLILPRHKDLDDVLPEYYATLFKEQDPAVIKAQQKVDWRVPCMSIVIQIVGSRGDVQPYLALAKELQTFGHRVRIATHDIFRKLIRDNGVEFFNIGGDSAELMAFMVENGGLIPSVASIARGDVGKKRKAIAEILRGTWKSCVEKDDETGAPFLAECIIANPPSFGHIHCAEKLGIPLHMSFTMPWTPTGSFPHPLTKIDHTDSVRRKWNKLSYTVVEQLTWSGLGDLINAFRRDIGLTRELSMWQGTESLIELKVPYTYCWSPSLIAKPVDWGDHIDITGFYFLDLASNYTPPDDLTDFLRAGPPPIYIGFGSITGYDPTKLTKAILEGVKLSGVRAIISKGWAGLGKGSDATSQDKQTFFIGDCPHDWLFKHVSAVCHHGGAGTLSAGLRCGKPTIVVPFFGDQFFWGAMVHRMKAGPKPIPAKHMNAEKLADAIRQALSPEMIEVAQNIASQMQQENGVRAGVNALHASLPLETMHSDFNDQYVAAYAISSAKLRISKPVAQVLALAGVITEADLRIHHTKEWVIPDDKDRILGHSAITGVADGFVSLFSETSRGIKSAKGKETAGDKTLAVTKGVGVGVGKLILLPLKGGLETYQEVSDGLYRAPGLWDATYKPRQQKHINGALTGTLEGMKTMGAGFADGIIDLVRKPVEFGKQDGALGVAKGVMVGATNCAFKPFMGMIGGVGMVGKGLYREATKGKSSSKVTQAITNGEEGEAVATGDWRVDAASMTGFDAMVCEQIVREFEARVVRKEGKLKRRKTK